MEGYQKDKAEIFGRAVKAGKRTYFFDVKSTKAGDYYITITESKKRFMEDGKFIYDKHKIFLYKEDFQKYLETLNETMDFIQQEQPFDPEEIKRQNNYPPNNNNNSEFTDVNFEDLDQK
ncbi:MAG: DUF3276 family protein [Bacteroidota bacterium]|jgi:hypothetical protein